MYEIVKFIIKGILPNFLIKDQGSNLRSLFSVFYKGKKQQCNICKFKVRKFVELKTNDLLCPKCGSLSRSRGLWDIIETEIEDKIVLHFSPSESLRNVVVKNGKTKKYITTDYEGEFESELALNIEEIDLDDDSIDTIICYHVLEHVENDIAAMQELFRILKPTGVCFIQTPFKEGAILEDKSVKSPEERLKRYGQKDHVRLYSPSGLNSRLREVGFMTELMEMRNDSENYYGFKTVDIILKCKKGGSQSI